MRPKFPAFDRSQLEYLHQVPVLVSDYTCFFRRFGYDLAVVLSKVDDVRVLKTSVEIVFFASWFTVCMPRVLCMWQIVEIGFRNP